MYLLIAKKFISWLKDNWIMVAAVAVLAACGVYVASMGVRINYLEGQNENLKASKEIQKRTIDNLVADVETWAKAAESLEDSNDRLMERFRLEKVRNDRLATALRDSQQRSSDYAARLESTVSEYETRISGLQTCEDMAAEMDAALREIVK